jgi:diguanylate cyclase (GGDEF)-like protein
MSESPLVFAVIDDDAEVRRLFGALVRGGGDSVIEAESVAAARVLLDEYPWDVALIDRRLPDGDGLELCRDVVDATRGTHRYIAIVSGIVDPEEKLRGFEAGAHDYIGKPMEIVELRARLGAIRRTVAAQKELLARVSMLEQLSIIDGLTQVYNHRFFQAELRRLFDIAARHDRPLSLAMIDIDHFKNVNDTFGHRAGDRILCEVSIVIAESVRSSDVLARYGGEEFALVLPETPVESATLIAERVRTAVESAVIREQLQRVPVTISIGLAAIPSPEIDTPGRLVEAADRALYLAKSRGRNRVECFTASEPAARERIRAKS